MSRPARSLLIAYISADNDLSPYVDEVLRRLQEGTRRQPHVNAVALVDRLGLGNSDLYLFDNGRRRQPAWLRGGRRFELDMESPETLGRFLQQVRARTRAERTLLSLIGHGTGPVPSCSWLPTVAPGSAPAERRQGFPYTPQSHPITPQSHPITPQGHPITPGDLSSGRTLSTPGLGRALLHATDGGAEPFDLIFFDQCFQGNLDVLYEFHEAARIFIASPNYAWLRAAYGSYLQIMGTAERVEQVASRIVTRYQQTLDAHHPNAIFWVRGRDVPAIARAADRLGATLADLVGRADEEQIRRLEAAIRHSQFVDTGRARGQFALGPGDELLGARSFAQNVRLWFPERDAPALYRAAGGLLQALQRVHSTYRVGHPHVAPDALWAYSDTLTLLAPRRRDATNRYGGVWRASLYRPEENFIAAWGPDPKQTVMVTQNLKYVHEGQWQRFINTWYENELLPAIGQPHYLHVRALVPVEDPLRLELTGERDEGDDTVRLSWQPAGADAVYTVLRYVPGYRWEILAATPALAFADAYSTAPTQYRVAVVDDEDRALALSNVVTL